jgi:hypothetical protein
LRPPGPSIRSVDLDDERTCFAEMSSERDTVCAGALDTDSIKLAVTAQPLQQSAIAGRRCRELAIVKLTPDTIDHRGMVALSVGVHAADDTNRRRCHSGHALPLPFAAVR